MFSTGLIPNGKGILVTNGNITINNFEFSGAKVADRNGAGTAMKAAISSSTTLISITTRTACSAAANATGSITINNSEFAFNGRGDGYTHNLYVSKIANLKIDNSYFHDAKVGHEIKSRALNTTITNSRIYDLNGTASYSIDLPNGGKGVIQNNLIEQGPLPRTRSSSASARKAVSTPAQPARQRQYDHQQSSSAFARGLTTRPPRRPRSPATASSD